jgi:hypothetical protein
LAAGEGGNLVLTGEDLKDGNYLSAAINLLPIVGPVLAKSGGKLFFKVGDKIIGEIDSATARQLAEIVEKEGCFVAGTMVATEQGLRPIEAILPSDQVWAYDPVMSQWSLQPVVAPLTFEYEGDFVVVSAGGAEVEATGNHPFWVVDGAGLEDRPVPRDVPPNEIAEANGGAWVEARSLRAGDVLLARSGETVVVQTVSVAVKRQSVYNLRVEGIHTYAVGRCQIIVHNNSEACEELITLTKDGKVVINKGVDWGGYLEKYVPKPAGMLNAHAHHILPKKGIGAAQQALVEAGQKILFKYHIDLVYGLENLTWASLIKGQHVEVNVQQVVDALQAADETVGSKQAVIDALKQMGKIAAART